MAHERMGNWSQSYTERRQGPERFPRPSPVLTSGLCREELIEAFKKFVNKLYSENRVFRNAKDVLENLMETWNSVQLSSTVDSVVVRLWRSELIAQILARSIGGLMCFTSLYMVFSLTRILWRTKIPLILTPVVAVAPAALLCSLVLFCILFSKYFFYPLIESFILDPSYSRTGSTLRSLQLLSQELRYQRTLYRLCLSDRDFTDQDYEMLLELDNEPGVQAMRRFIEGVSPEKIRSLPTYRYGKRNGKLSCDDSKSYTRETLATKCKVSSSYGTKLLYFWTVLYHFLQRFLSRNTFSRNSNWTQNEEESRLLEQHDTTSCVNLPSLGKQKDSFSSLRSSPSTDSCPICLEEFRQQDLIRILPCKHEFHGDCIFPWLLERGKCPVCKYSIAEY